MTALDTVCVELVDWRPDVVAESIEHKLGVRKVGSSNLFALPSLALGINMKVHGLVRTVSR